MSSWHTGLAVSAAGVAPNEQVVDRLRTLLLHNIGVGLGACHRSVARAALHMAPGFGDGDFVWFGGGSSGLLGAIFANATCMAASIQEDAWNGQHLGSALIPTALAVAQQQGSSGGEFLAALAAGYGAAMAVAGRYGAATGARGFRGTALYGQLGAAVVAAHLLGLNAEGVGRAMAIAANTPGGVPGPLLAGYDEVLFQSGLAAVKGTMAALAAREPIAVSPDAFEGRGYFGAAYAGVEPSPAVPTAVPPLGELVLDVGVRRYPLNHLCVAPVAAVLDAAGGRELVPAEIESVTVWMAPGEVRGVTDSGPFRRPMQAMFGVPLAVAAALCDGGLTLDSLQARAVDPVALALAGRVRVEPSSGMAPLTAQVAVRTPSAEAWGQALNPELLHRPSFEAVKPGWLEAGRGALVAAVEALPAGSPGALLKAIGA
ncbi:MAG TPA: MmgE/PrpD family protein [Symbiobacteriaceae bacterium]|nr:MmgE/PrpD family protein [Symbiobacteriaceae bacterium]